MNTPLIARTVHARTHAIASGHPLATAAGLDVLEAGGNAVDAGVAAGIALGVVHPDLVNVAGVAPIILRIAETGETITIDGLGVWPAAASAAFFAENHGGAIPEGLLRTVIPAAPAAWITALRDHGTMRFGEVAAAAIRYARDGFEVYPLLAEFIADHQADYARYPANAAIFLPGGRPPKTGETFVQTDLAAMLQSMADAESAASGTREEGLQAARDLFYRGDIARRITDHHRENGGLLTMHDLAAYDVRREVPLSVPFRGHEVLTCGAWCQGISFAQLMALLDLDTAPASLATRSDPARLHRLIEAMNLIFADREAFVADPSHVDIPVAAMLHPNYLRRTLARIDPARAFGAMPEPGNPGPRGTVPPPPGQSGELRIPPDTSHVCVIDSAGNMFAATPSDTSCDTEVIPGLGICPSSRGSQSRGVVGHLNAVAPGKRPRLTPNPALVLKDGAPFLAFGTPGGDVQIQAMAQVLIDMLDFDMPLDQAIAAPRVASYNFPSSFAPNEYLPGRVMVEQPLADTACDALNALGHDAQAWPQQTWKAGGICAVHRASDGSLTASADPRRAGKAGGR